jgi:hypothetical protein
MDSYSGPQVEYTLYQRSISKSQVFVLIVRMMCKVQLHALDFHELAFLCKHLGFKWLPNTLHVGGINFSGCSVFSVSHWMFTAVNFQHQRVTHYVTISK